MRRPPVACRRAVQSLQSSSSQHIWISDDLLTGALNRFFLSSCPQQKRHGSHVPGPLEARRRAAKRRMTVSAGFYPQENFAPLFNLGALFGFRKDDPPTWRYEAPSLQTHAEPLTSRTLRSAFSTYTQLILTAAQHVPSLPTTQPDRTSSKHTASTTAASAFGAPYPFSQNTSRDKPQKHLSRSGECTVDALDPEAHFDDFKTKIANAGTLPSTERGRLLHQSWISCRPATNIDWVYNVMVIKHLTENRWDHTRILSGLKFFNLPPTYTPESLDLLKCLETSGAYLPHASRVHRRVYSKMIEAGTSAADSTSSLQDTQLLTLIRSALRSCSYVTEAGQSDVGDLCLLADKIEASNLRKAIRSLLADFDDAEQVIMLMIARAPHNYLHAVEEILFFLPEERLQSLVPSVTLSLIQGVRKTRLSAETYWHRARAWMTVLGNLDARFDATCSNSTYIQIAFTEVAEYVFKSERTGTKRPLLLLYALAFRTAQQPGYGEYKDSWLQCVHAYAASAPEQQGTLRMEDEVVKVFEHMRTASIRYGPMMSMAVHTFTSHASLRSLRRFQYLVQKYRFPLHNIKAIQTRLAAELPTLRHQPNLQTLQEREQHASTLRACQYISDSLNKFAGPDISTTLVSDQEEMGTLQARREFVAILDRASDYHALPPAYADLTADIPFSQRTALVHQLAHHYSIATTRSHTATWRSMYQLYNYLESHSLPIGPLFTKAVVRAAIIRPMMEHRFISARRLIWVCQLVARVEGEKVARQIEGAFHRWRGGLIKHAKEVHDAAGGDRGAKAMVGRLKQLNLLGSKDD